MGRPIVASSRVAAPPDAVFRFLDRLENHARLAPGSVQMLYLHPGPDGGAHALVRLNGPRGVQRTARTDLLRTPTGSNYVAGRATIGTRTEACVTWTIEGGNPGSVVTLWVNVLSTDLRDRLLLRLGGRRWLKGHFQGALERLSEELAPATVQTNGDRPQLALANGAA
jgi:Polyketide cyclase / dehydrase and lipid transport